MLYTSAKNVPEFAKTPKSAWNQFLQVDKMCAATFLYFSDKSKHGGGVSETGLSTWGVMMEGHLEICYESDEKNIHKTQFSFSSEV